MKRIAQIYAPVILLLMGVALRVFFIDRNPAWYDEAFTLLVARLPDTAFASAILGDVHPPLYYIIIRGLLHVFSVFDQVVVLRAFSVLCSIAAILVVYDLAEYLQFGDRARLAVMAMMCLMSTQIWYAQEGRMYAWLQLLAVQQMGDMLKRNYGRLAINSILAMYLHNYGVFFTVIIYLVALIREYVTSRSAATPGRSLTVILSGLLAGLVYAPWFVFVVLRQMAMATGGMGYWIQPLTVGSVAYAVLRIVMTTTMPDWAMILAGPGLGLMMFYALLTGYKNRRWELIALAVGPLVLVLALSLIWRSVLLYRGLIVIIPALVLLAAESLDNRRAWIWTALAVPAMVLALGNLLYGNSLGTLKGADAILYSESSGTVYHTGDTTMILYLLYRPGIQSYYLDTGCTPDPGALSTQTRAALGVETVTQADLPEDYNLIAVSSVLSTQCAINALAQITDQQQLVRSESLYIGVNEVWHVAH